MAKEEAMVVAWPLLQERAAVVLAAGLLLMKEWAATKAASTLIQERAAAVTAAALPLFQVRLAVVTAAAAWLLIQGQAAMAADSKFRAQRAEMLCLHYHQLQSRQVISGR